ncbi:hypothetical protein EV702DRAFT_1177654 [Suillus placidus]|uniref:Uncharacterized protein n=1 Tax=Suillus placidus TaxID=48579 RepID=A0A9P7D6J5_9AGAM|nr:hypothetical protein EV702DRAFT_1177654 [Suillus placidus]
MGGQSALHGAFLWRQADTVVELRQNWRAKEDPLFVKMLSQFAVRVGQMTHVSDYEVLKTRLLSNIKHQSAEEFASFKNAPIVVTRKFLRDAINESKARAFAQDTAQQFETYFSTEQQRCLWNIDSTHTNGAIGQLPLIHGMLIVNGSRGTLKSIIYEKDIEGFRYAACVLVEVPGSVLAVPGLDDGVVPILPVTTSFKFAVGESSVNIRRTQLPILPGWAFTDFKVQGNSLSPVIVDLTYARSLQSIYVMLSRASSLHNVGILRWFSSKMLQLALQGDAREELKRLSGIADDTRQKYMTAHNIT